VRASSSAVGSISAARKSGAASRAFPALSSSIARVSASARMPDRGAPLAAPCAAVGAASGGARRSRRAASAGPVRVGTCAARGACDAALTASR
jgi:hypothetical protein